MVADLAALAKRSGEEPDISGVDVGQLTVDELVRLRTQVVQAFWIDKLLLADLEVTSTRLSSTTSTLKEMRERIENRKMYIMTLDAAMQKKAAVELSQAVRASAEAAAAAADAADETHKALESFKETVKIASATSTGVARWVGTLTVGLLLAAAVTAAATVTDAGFELRPGLPGVALAVGGAVLGIPAGMLIGGWRRAKAEEAPADNAGAGADE